MSNEYYKFVHYLVTEKNYKIVTIHREKKEIWLKSKEKKTELVRIIQKDFTWDNDWNESNNEALLKADQLRVYFGLEECHLLHIVFTSSDLYDEWKEKYKDVSYLDHDILKMDTIAVHENSLGTKQGYQELSRFLQCDVVNDMSIYEQNKKTIEQLFEETNEANQRLKKKEKIFVPYLKPYLTYILLGIQLIMFLILELSGGSTNSYTLVEFGAKFNPLIDAGEWWRLITPIFLHIGFIHLAMNSYSLILVGQEVERIYGRIRFLLIYLFSGFTGCLASYLLSDSISAGASGAIFGCLGALLYVSKNGAKGYKEIFSSPIMIIIIINLIFGLTTPGIDNAGHLGGLAGGFIISGALRISPNRKDKAWIKVLYSSLICAILIYSVSMFVL